MSRFYIKRVTAFAVIFLVMCLSFPAVGFAEQDGLQVIKLQLRWDNQFQFAGYYAADWQGYYAEEGLKVEIIPGIKSDQSVLSSVKEVSKGRADFGIGSSDILIANDEGADLRVVAVIMQRSAARYYIKQGTKYTSPSDLTRLKVARNVNDLVDIELQAMLISEGIDPKLIKAYPHLAGMDHLISDKVQVMPGYKLGIPYTANQKGISIREINPQDYGVDFYGDSLFASGTFVDQNPELVEKFRRASLKGWEYAFNNSEEIAMRISQDLINYGGYSDLLNFNLYQAQVMMELADYPIIDVGHINPYRWQKMIDFLKSDGLIKNEVDINNLIFDPVKLAMQKEKQKNDLFIKVVLFAVSLLILIGLRALLLRRVTQLKLENELKESENQFRRAIESAPIPIMLHAEDGQVLKISKEWSDLTGYDLCDIPTTDIWAEKAYGNNKESVKAVIDNSYNLTDKHSEGEYKVRTNNNQTKIWEFYSAQIGILRDGRKIAMSVAIDITERKEAQEQILRLSYRDQLTGLYNRRFYEEELRRLDVERNLPITLIMTDVNGLKLTNDAFGHQAGDAILKTISELLQNECRTDEIISRIGGDEFVILLPKTDSETAKKLIQRIGDAINKAATQNALISLSMGYAVKDSILKQFDEIFKEAEDDMYRHKLTESSSFRSKFIEVIMNSLYEKSSREMNHSKRVSYLCEQIASNLGFSQEEIRECRVAGLVHDIGKIGVSNIILDKDGKLTNEEWAEMKKHSEMGYRILSPVVEFSEIADYVLSHQERWDGKGYPQALKGKQIPIQSRIIAVADSFDAMTVERSYKKVMSEIEAIQEIEKCAGTQFDPEIAKIFIQKVLLGKK